MNGLTEARVFGPPGTGKTTFVARQVRAAAERHGSDAVLVASFTKAAAAELAGRDMPIDRSRIGTLHAHALRAIGSVQLAVEKIKEWNEEHPAYLLTPERSAGSDDDDVETPTFGSRKTPTDEIAEHYHALRGRLIDPQWWPLSVRAFADRWETWKRERDYLDFTDLIEIGPSVSPVGQPTIGFFDEVQDFTPLELQLVRAWGADMERIVLAGDDDQAIYGFKGASPEAFLSPAVPDEMKRTLTQSYRVPAAVHAAASAWIERVTHREPKAYKPRAAEGSVEVMEWATSRNPLPAVLDAEERLRDDDPEPGTRVMFLASCGFMLDSVVSELRRRGIPFHNPYQRKNGAWNPLGFKRKGATSTAERLVSFSRISEDIWRDGARMWSPSEMLAWVQPLRDKVFVKGGKKALIAELKAERSIDFQGLGEYIADLADDPLGRIFATDLDWYERNALAAYTRGLIYPLEVCRASGVRTLAVPPRVVVGTIHSVKGAEAKHVYLIPDLSPAAARQWMGESPLAAEDMAGGYGNDPDSIILQFYVAMTRASERLVVCGKSSPLAVEPYDLIEGAA
jgi:DNA helicase II / ATP-dependent DNA helicase PcrA